MPTCITLTALVCVAAQPAKRRKTVIDIPAAKFPEANAESYATQLKAKKERVEKLFEGLGAPDLELHESQVEHYRLRSVSNLYSSYREPKTSLGMKPSTEPCQAAARAHV